MLLSRCPPDFTVRDMKGRKVIVIDDEADVVIYLETTLVDDCGLEVFTATNGKEGLDLIRKHDPDLVCLDILMPESTGLSLYRTMKSTPELQQIPVLIISGLELENDMATYLEGLPAPEAYLEKPVAPEVLIEMVTALVKEHSKD